MIPRFESYYRYSSDNYGVHSLHFTDGQGNSFYFSYQTLVAFYTPSTGLVVRQNDWGPTTGKHLNAIEPDKSKRVDSVEFERLYHSVFDPRGECVEG